MLDSVLIDRSLLGAPFTEPTWVAVLFVKLLAINALGYIIPAGLVFGLICVVFRRRLEPMRVQPQRRATPRQIRREILWSLSSTVVFTVVGTVIVAMAARGWTQFYFDPGALGWGYLIFSFILLTVLHDTYFYWTHRAMHQPRIFAALHQIHHRSFTPTPWTCYSFSPGEAVVQALFYPLVVLTVPLHPTVVVLFSLHQIVRNTLGHSGFDLVPPAVARSPWFSWSIATTHHDLHHSGAEGNFALYFSWWDRLMGTNVPRSSYPAHHAS